MSFYEAAIIDGANRWHQFWNVTLPLLWDTMQTAMVYAGLGAFNMFAITKVMVVSGSSTNRPADVLSTYLYEQAFEASRFGYATAIGVALFLLMLVLSVFTMRRDAAGNGRVLGREETHDVSRTETNKITSTIDPDHHLSLLGFLVTDCDFSDAVGPGQLLQDQQRDLLQPLATAGHTACGTTLRAPGAKPIWDCTSSTRLGVLIPAIFFTLLFSAMAGYVLARYVFPGNRAVFFMFTGGMLFPVILALVPLFFLLRSIPSFGGNLLDTHFGIDPGVHCLLSALYRLLYDGLFQDACPRNCWRRRSLMEPTNTSCSSKSSSPWRRTAW